MRAFLEVFKGSTTPAGKYGPHSECFNKFVRRNVVVDVLHLLAMFSLWFLQSTCFLDFLDSIDFWEVTEDNLSSVELNTLKGSGGVGRCL